MRTQYSSAPLPFMGQKRRFVEEFRHILRQFGDTTLFVDLFGGSGLLSNITKCELPNATVVYNDYDNYRQRLANIPRTNTLLSDLRKIVEHCPRDKRLPLPIKNTLLARIEEEESTGFVDYITLSSSLLFSMKYVLSFTDLCGQTIYNRIKQTDYVCNEYLDGLVIENCDYRELFQKYRHVPGVVFIVDPPYLSTEVGTYNMNWGLSDYLDVLTVLSGTSFIYFTSNKSSILELCTWIARNNTIGNPFAGTSKKILNIQLNNHAAYMDIMLYKKGVVQELVDTA